MAASIDQSSNQSINKKLKIGVPRKNGFNEFMNVEGTIDNQPNATGFPIDVFKEVIKLLPYDISYEFIPYEDNASAPAIYDSPGYYDSLISKVYLKVSYALQFK